MATAEEKKWVDEKKKLTEQLFINPDIEIPSFPVSPWTPYFRTNNFIQQNIARLMGFNPTEKKWYPVFVDTTGRILTSPEITAGTQVFLKDREAITISIMEGEVIPAATLATHAAEDVEEFLNKTVLVSTSAQATVYVQFSDDAVNWYEWRDLSDTAITFSVNNEKKCFGFADHTRYMRVIVHNTSASNNTVSLKILGAV